MLSTVIKEIYMKDNLHAFTIRVSQELKDWLTQQAEKNHRSRTGEVVAILEAAAQSGQPAD